jgi:hypothetical protein
MREKIHGSQEKKAEETYMKRILTSIFVAAGIAGPFVSHVAARDLRMGADIPFAFVANNTAMPAGSYQLTQTGASGSAFVLRNVTGKTIFVNMAARQDGKPDNPSLTFACQGKECVLARIAPPGSLTAYSLGQAAIEKNLNHSLRIASMVSIKLAAR